MASGSGTQSYAARRDLYYYHITVDTEGLFHHDCLGLDHRGPFRSLAEVLGTLKLGLKPGSLMLPGAEAYGELFPLVADSESLPPPTPWSKLKHDEVLQFVRSTFKKMANDAQMDTKPAKQPVEKSWMDTIIEELTPTCTDPDILKATNRFERLIERQEAIKNGMKWMRKEVLQAFKSYISSAGYNKNFEYDFVRLDYQCLICGNFSKSYHHYNFTMRTRLSRLKPWNYQRFFAEVKPVEYETEYFCCPLQPSEDGHCFGCQKAGVSLRHPDSGGYDKGHPGCGFPFDTDSESDD